VNPGLEGKTIFEYLQRRYTGRFAEGQLRTLQRRVKVWRATEGPVKEVFFAQRHQPGRLSASDFTHMSELEITIQGTLARKTTMVATSEARRMIKSASSTRGRRNLPNWKFDMLRRKTRLCTVCGTIGCGRYPQAVPRRRKTPGRPLR
jgi:hypothetical protein